MLLNILALTEKIKQILKYLIKRRSGEIIKEMISNLSVTSSS